MIDPRFLEHMRDASGEELTAVLLTAAQLLAERKGRPLGLVHDPGVAALVGIGPFAVYVHRANKMIGDLLMDGPDRAGVIAEGRMAEQRFPAAVTPGRDQ